MKTNELIAVLAAQATTVDGAAVLRRFHARLAAGVVLTVGAMLLLNGAPGLVASEWTAGLWLKLFFTGALAAATAVGLRRVGYPGMRLGRFPAAAALPLVLLWMVAGLVLLTAPAEARLPLLLGQTWRECPIYIGLLSLPVLALSLWAVRALAPTRPMLAGAVAGLFSGAVAAFAYGLHCPEVQAPFVAVWYVLGILVPTGAGALLGPRLLRW